MGGKQSLVLILGVLLFSFFITSSLVVPFINLLYKLKVTRRVGKSLKGKKSLFEELHKGKAGTPIGGGILLVTVITVLFAAIFPITSHMGIKIASAFDLKSELFVIFFTFISFGLLGLSDDLVKIFGKGSTKDSPLSVRFGLRRSHKFALQWLLAGYIGYLIYAKLGVHILHVPLIGRTLDLGIGYIPFAAFLIVLFVNAYNMTDGLDGLAVGLLLFFLIAFGIIAAGNLDTPLSIFISLWIGALLAFLYFNIYPARVFLGDAGALSFGAMIAVAGLITGSVFSLFVIGGLFIVEIVSSAIQILGWKYLKKPIFPIAPIHHSLLAVGWEEPKIVMRAWLVSILLAIFGLWLALT